MISRLMELTSRSPQISVIIPTFNREQFVIKAIASVLQQSYNNLEVIVVDDGSTDNTECVVRSLMKSDQRVRYLLRRTNGGAQAARNTGIQAAEGAYIAFLDSDNIWLPDKLHKQMTLFEGGDSSLGAVYCGYRRLSADGSVRDILPHFRGGIYRTALLNWIADTSTLLVHRDVLAKAGGFDERVRAYQEWDLCIRLARWGQFDYVPEALVLYAAHAGTRISNDRTLNTLGKLDVVELHRSEILREFGKAALSKHYWEIGWLFVDETRRFDLARRAFWKAWRTDTSQESARACFWGTLIGLLGSSYLEKQRHRFHTADSANSELANIDLGFDRCDKLLIDIAAEHRRSGRWDWAYYYYSRALELAAISGDIASSAECTYCIGLYYTHESQLKPARLFLQQSLELHRCLSDHQREADILNKLFLFDKE